MAQGIGARRYLRSGPQSGLFSTSKRTHRHRYSTGCLSIFSIRYRIDICTAWQTTLDIIPLKRLGSASFSSDYSSAWKNNRRVCSSIDDSCAHYGDMRLLVCLTSMHARRPIRWRLRTGPTAVSGIDVAQTLTWRVHTVVQIWRCIKVCQRGSHLWSSKIQDCRP